MKRLPLYVWLLAVVAFTTLALLPQATRLSRGGQIALAALLAGTVVWKCRRSVLRYVFGGLFVLIGAFLLWPAPQRARAADLRAGYVEHLRSYTGCPYFWGGESTRGIDCSGLIRRGLIDVLFVRGFHTVDPALVRRSLSLWWNHTSALALSQEHGGLTKLLFTADSLNEIDAARLRPATSP